MNQLRRQHYTLELAIMQSLSLSDSLQKQGISCDLVPQVKKMSALFTRAEHCRYLLLLQANFTWQLRDLKNRQNIAGGTAEEILKFFGEPFGEP